MVYIHKSGMPQKIRPDMRSPDEEAWLEVPSDGSTARWLRRDGSLIRFWNNTRTCPSVSCYMQVSAPGALTMYDAHLLVDEGL